MAASNSSCSGIETSASAVPSEADSSATIGQKRGKYKKYLRDPKAKIPRMTLWNLKNIKQKQPTTEGINNSFSIGDSDEELSEIDEPSEARTPEEQSDADFHTEQLYDPPIQPDNISIDHDNPENIASSQHLIPAELFDMVYPGSKVTICRAYFSIMHFSHKNKLTDTAIEDLLSLLRLFCPDGSKLPSSFYKFRKFFRKFSGSHRKQNYCFECETTTDGNVCATPTCTATSGQGHIVHLSMEKSLQNLVSNHWKDLDYPFSSSLHDGAIHDIWNGEVLKSETEEGKFFSSREHLAFSLSTDGVPIFKSSSVSLWPVYLIVNNLPPIIRMNSENVILSSLWCGPSKPPMHILLDVVVNNLKQLATLGVLLQTPSGLKTIRGKLLLGVFDLPAKAAVLNMKQFNGEYGCATCLHKGMHQGGARVYLPQSCTERTKKTVHECARKAEVTGNAVQGIKGHSILSEVCDVVKSVPFDYMHAVLEGVTRWFLHSWFDSTHHAEAYYIGKYLNAIDSDLIQQRPPSEISRSPRSIAKHMNYWKASELRSWLLYYSLPIILKYLPALYFHHFSLLVCAIHILLQDSLTEKKICAAEQMISDFFDMLPELYGNRSCTANAHSLNHLCKYVRLWGPLWTHSAFGYESKNGHLKNMFHAKSSVIDQLLFAADISLTLNLMQSSLEENESETTKTFIEDMTGHALRPNMRELSEHIYAIGRSKKTTLPQNEATLIHQDTAQIFGKAFVNNCLYYSNEGCNEESRRNNTICTYIIMVVCEGLDRFRSLLTSQSH